MTGSARPFVLHVVGARPQFIKLAPVCAAFEAEDIPCRILHTGQHYDYSMNQVHFATLGLPTPDFHLGIGSQSHAVQTARMLSATEEIIRQERPALVMVYGDTNSTLAAALSAAKLGIPIAHVEAGVRSFDRAMPEEINRVVTDRIADFHFCPTEHAVELLQREGVRGIWTGDVMLDALQKFSRHRVEHGHQPPFILTTIHRAENTNNPERFNAIWQALQAVADEIPLIFPVHPRTRNMFPAIASHGRLQVIDPVSYLEMIAMIGDAAGVITDSGGLQKEAFLLQTPCLTVRDTTEWPETISAGGNRLVGPETAAIVAAARQMRRTRPAWDSNPFGDGHASYHIAAALRSAGIA